MAAARSPVAIVVSPQSADVSESENTTLGISFIGLANGPEARASTWPTPVGGGTDEVRAGVAQGLDSPTGAVIGASRSGPVGAPIEWSDIAVERDRQFRDE
jgi:hypothetical protein